MSIFLKSKELPSVSREIFALAVWTSDEDRYSARYDDMALGIAESIFDDRLAIVKRDGACRCPSLFLKEREPDTNWDISPVFILGEILYVLYSFDDTTQEYVFVTLEDWKKGDCHLDESSLEEYIESRLEEDMGESKEED